jgi:hypothetical protein
MNTIASSESDGGETRIFHIAQRGTSVFDFQDSRHQTQKHREVYWKATLYIEILPT